ncbi:MAG: FecR domain-containing protein, partial [Opitutaceae bacterium]|nr:FecR domain-containing protein [Opitutaceae bacterium]
MKPRDETHLLDEAADWLARKDLGLSLGEQREFDDWLGRNARHAAAWAEVNEPWQKLEDARQDGLADWMMVELEQRVRRRATRRRYIRLSGWAAAIVVLGGVSVATWRYRPPVPARPVEAAPPAVAVIQGGHATGVAPGTAEWLRPEQRVLADGTVVELKGDALISVSFTGRRRLVRLVNGTAHFEVAHDASRPFIVRTGAASVRAVGTAFAVECSDTAVDVLVTKGRVGVARTKEEIETSAPVLAGAGSRVRVSNNAADGAPTVEALDPQEMDRRLQWRAVRLQLRGASLAQIVEMLNSVGETSITIADPALEHVRF